MAATAFPASWCAGGHFLTAPGYPTYYASLPDCNCYCVYDYFYPLPDDPVQLDHIRQHYQWMAAWSMATYGTVLPPATLGLMAAQHEKFYHCHYQYLQQLQLQETQSHWPCYSHVCEPDMRWPGASAASASDAHMGDVPVAVASLLPPRQLAHQAQQYQAEEQEPAEAAEFAWSACCPRPCDLARLSLPTRRATAASWGTCSSGAASPGSAAGASASASLLDSCVAV